MDVREPLRGETRAVVHRVDGEGVRRDLRRQRQAADAVERRPIRGVRLLPAPRIADGVDDRDRPQPDAAPRRAGRGVGERLERPFEGLLGQRGAAARAGEPAPRPAGPLVERLVDEDDLAGALRAREHLAPHRVVDPPAGRPVGVERFVHPADLRRRIVEERPGGAGEGVGVEGQVVVAGDEGGGRREVAQNRAAGAPRRRGPALRRPLPFQRPAVRGRRGPAPLRGDAGHPRPAEAVQHEVARPRVVQDGRDDRQVRHLGVVAVRPVEGIGLADADVDRERLAVVRLPGVVGPAVALHELGQERVGAGGVVRRVRQPEDVRVRPRREVGPPPQRGEHRPQPFEEVRAPRRVRLEGPAEALDRPGRRGGRVVPQQLRRRVTPGHGARPPGPCRGGPP